MRFVSVNEYPLSPILDFNLTGGRRVAENGDKNRQACKRHANWSLCQAGGSEEASGNDSNGNRQEEIITVGSVYRGGAFYFFKKDKDIDGDY